MSNPLRRTLCATAIIACCSFAGASHVAAGGDDTPWDVDDLPIGGLPGDPPPPEPPDPEVNPDLDLPDLDLTNPALPPEPPFPPEPPDPEVNPDLDLPDLDLTDPTLPPEPPFPPCSEYDPDAFGATIADNGDGTAHVQVGYFDGEDACNAVVDVISWRTDAAYDQDEVLDWWSTDVNSLEAAAAGDASLETDIELDPCFSRVVVRVETETQATETLAMEHFGLGCSISVTKDFDGDPYDAAINLVHAEGWTPDHVFEMTSDDAVVWDELPSGDYTVSEFDGAEDGTTISVDGGAPVPHAGEPVAVTVGQSVLVTNPDTSLDLTDPTVPDPDEDDDPKDGPDPTVPDGDLPTTGSSMTGTLATLGLLAGLGGLGCTAIARRRR